MTPNEITSLIASSFDKELDIPFRLQLMERVKVWRSRMVTNTLGKSPEQRKFFKQALLATMHPEDDIPGAPLVASPIAATDELPLLIKMGGQLFDYVGGADGKSPWREVQIGTSNYMSEGQFSSMFPEYKYENRRIKTPKSDQPLIMVDAVWDDPMKIVELNCACTGIPCDVWNEEYPVSGDILQLIIQSILQIDYGQKVDKEATPEVNV